ncbi:MAG: hypothetical protein JNM25_09080 [Planctomycetes bacterium]|nr:hypothetical protein [Planctomycetota bacterium]
MARTPLRYEVLVFAGTLVAYVLAVALGLAALVAVWCCFPCPSPPG